MSPEQTKTSLILGLRLENGSLTVKNGVVADCMEKGGSIIVDEAAHSVQEILLMFNSILDRTSVTAIGDKMIYANEDFLIVFCANDSRYAGSVKLPQSFAQRLVSFYFDYPVADDELLQFSGAALMVLLQMIGAAKTVTPAVQCFCEEAAFQLRYEFFPAQEKQAAYKSILEFAERIK